MDPVCISIVSSCDARLSLLLLLPPPPPHATLIIFILEQNELHSTTAAAAATKNGQQLVQFRHSFLLFVFCRLLLLLLPVYATHNLSLSTAQPYVHVTNITSNQQ